MSKYTVVGYDKDHDIYVEYDDSYMESDAVSAAEKLAKLVQTDELRREETGEPIDWIEVYKNWGEENEEKVWASYDIVTEKERDDYFKKISLFFPSKIKVLSDICKQYGNDFPAELGQYFGGNKNFMFIDPISLALIKEDYGMYLEISEEKNGQMIAYPSGEALKHVWDVFPQIEQKILDFDKKQKELEEDYEI